MAVSELMNYEWVVYAALSAVLTGLMPGFLKLGTQKIAPSFSAFIYSLLYSVFLALMFIVNGGKDFFSALSAGCITQLLCIGTITALSYLCFTTALSYGGIAKVVPILLLRKIFSLGIDFYTGSVVPGKLQICSLILLVLGILLLESGKSRNSHSIWILFAALSLALFVLEDILLDRIWTAYPLATDSGELIIGLVSTVLLLLIILLGCSIMKPGKIAVRNWVYLLLAGVASGLAALCSERATLTGNNRFLQPISSLWFPIAMLAARLVHKEEFPVGALVGILMIIVGNFGLMLA